MAAQSADAVGTLYEYYMAIDGAAEDQKATTENRDKYAYILSAVYIKDNDGARQLSADFIGRLFKFFPNETERSVQALGQLCSDANPAIRKKAAETLVEVCNHKVEYVKRVADLLVQLFSIADASESKGYQQCLIKLLQIEPRQALEGILDQVVTGEEQIRQPAIKFLRNKLGEIPSSANNSELANFLIQEYKKIIPDATLDELEQLIMSLFNMKVFQTVNGTQLLVGLLTDLASNGPPFGIKTTEQKERTITCCRLSLPSFGRVINSTKLVEYFCEQIIPYVIPDASEASLPTLQVFAELCSSVGELQNYKDNLRVVMSKLLEFLPPIGELADPETLPTLEFSAVECLLSALHALGKRHPQFFTEPEQADAFKDLQQRLQYFNSCMQLHMQKFAGAAQKLNTVDAELKKAETLRRITTNIKALILDLCRNPPHFKAPVHFSWKKESAGGDKAQHARIESVVSTKRKTDESNPVIPGKIRTKYAPGTGRITAVAGRAANKTSTLRPVASAADQAKLDARAKRFGTGAAAAAVEPTRTKRKPIV
ncbi:apoptosis inhibitor 5-like [Paramacrobiotus metropolitanus]|uniref:apoptosis inhibitor 5-like n=1 Tax=Paramacrobiotus metropolitanus TaxID=2943436 RepID=UPI002445A534|nr:apoptosis inhibitor 5-like [Paramacrobiotus metropolitanus]